MKKISRDGLILCEIQARAFELSVDEVDSSSAIFARRFMMSEVAKSFDNGTIIDSNLQPKDVIQLVEEEYGASSYGSVKFTHDEMYWIGYIYRYFVSTYDLSSIQVYRILKPKELRDVFLPYHTMDPSQSIERILEAKGISFAEDAELIRQYKIFRRIREDEMSYGKKK